MSYHMHNNREEVWTVVSGNGKAIIDGVIWWLKKEML